MRMEDPVSTSLPVTTSSSLGSPSKSSVGSIRTSSLAVRCEGRACMSPNPQRRPLTSRSVRRTGTGSDLQPLTSVSTADIPCNASATKHRNHNVCREVASSQPLRPVAPITQRGRKGAHDKSRPIRGGLKKSGAVLARSWSRVSLVSDPDQIAGYGGTGVLNRHAKHE